MAHVGEMSGQSWAEFDKFGAIASQRFATSSSCATGPQQRSRRTLPPGLYAQYVAPFLRFGDALPNMLYSFGGRNQSRGPLNVVAPRPAMVFLWVSCRCL